MLKTVKGVYTNGTVELSEIPLGIESQVDVFVTFFTEDRQLKNGRQIEGSSDAKRSIVAELYTLIDETQRAYLDGHNDKAAFKQFVQVVNDRLLSTYQQASDTHLRLIVLLKTALRRLNTIPLEIRHLALFEQILAHLTEEVVTEDDIIDFQRRLQDAGIETLMRLESHFDELMALYEKYNDLDWLAGSWSEEEYSEFMQNTADFRRIDTELSTAIH